MKNIFCSHICMVSQHFDFWVAIGSFVWGACFHWGCCQMFYLWLENTWNLPWHSSGSHRCFKQLWLRSVSESRYGIKFLVVENEITGIWQRPLAKIELHWFLSKTIHAYFGNESSNSKFFQTWQQNNKPSNNVIFAHNLSDSFSAFVWSIPLKYLSLAKTVSLLHISFFFGLSGFEKTALPCSTSCVG